jgi:RimJ/RimL family protein N-acetyltransferase
LRKIFAALCENLDTMSSQYLFTSQRLGFRNWTEADLDAMSRINADEQVMQFFPSVQTTGQTHAFIHRMQAQYARLGFCYFAVELLESGRFIGFIGLGEQTYLPDMGPFVDIGWRLAGDVHGAGYATEGAVRCIEYAFRTLGLPEIYAVCPAVNKPSEKVMIKAGMSFVRFFDHPLLQANDRLRKCALYSIVNDLWLSII